MANYIDTDDAWDEGTLQDWYMSSIDNTIPPIWTEEHISELCNDFLVIPKEAPAADVRPERHGEWLVSGECYECSECGGGSNVNTNPYCWKCGAKMEGANENYTDNVKTS